MSVNIIYEDDFVIICHKLAGTSVETAKIGEIDMVSQLRNYMNEKTQNPYIGVVHRLDQPVEGIILFGKNQDVTAKLNKQISQNEMKKIYLAVLCGNPNKNEEKLIDYLLKNGKTNTSTIEDKSVPQAKRSELNYHIIKRYEDLALAKIELLTGRHHQIRVQMANADLPLWGDAKYNKKCPIQRGEKLALCAYQLSFSHPVTKKEMSFQVEPKNEIFQQFS